MESQQERSRVMNEAQKKNPTKKRFDGKLRQEEEERIKEVILAATQRRRANKEIDCILKQFRGKRIIDLLPVIKRRFSRNVLTVALERVERKRYELGNKDAIFLAEFKASLESE